VRQTEGSRHNLIGLLLCDIQLRRRITHRHRLRRKWTLTTKGQRIAYILDIHSLRRQQRHVPAYFLEVQRRHRNARRKFTLRDGDVAVIPIQQIQTVPHTPLLLTVLQRNGQVIGLCLGHTKGDGIVVRDRLDHAIEMVRIQTDIQTRRRVVILVMLKLVCIQAHMRQNGAGVVHRNHANTILIKDQAHLHQHGLQTLCQSADGSSLNCLSDYEFVRHSFV
jgi:hypothetical protein